MAEKIVTVITMYRAYDAESFVTVVVGELTDDQKSEWRKAHLCDDFATDEDEPDNMFFRTITLNETPTASTLFNIDGEKPPSALSSDDWRAYCETNEPHVDEETND